MRWDILLSVAGLLLTSVSGHDLDQELKSDLFEAQDETFHREKRDVVAEEVFFSGDGEEDSSVEQPVGRARRLPPPPRGRGAGMVPWGHFKRCDRRPVRIRNHRTGEIVSPSDTHGFYPPRAQCKWVIIAPKRYTVDINIVMLDIKYTFYCWPNYLKVYEGAGKRARLLGTYCGSTAPANVIRSNRNQALIHFNSGGDVGIQKRGFKLEFSLHQSALIRRAPACPRHAVRVTDKQGQLTSPGYPRSSYPRRLDCQWHIMAQTNCTVDLTFEDFALKDSEGCKEDYLRITDGLDPKANRVVDFCGHRGLRPITTHSNQVLIQFKSNHRTTRAERGFSIRYAVRCPWDPKGPSGRNPAPPPVCGQPEIPEQLCAGGRVIGGNRVCTPHAYPWMVQMKVYFPGKNYQHFCGAVLVDTKFVLTTRHCMSYRDSRGNWYNLMRDLPRIKLISGEHDTQKTDFEERSHTVSKAIPYEPYYNVTHRNDIVLLKIDPPAQLGRAAMPICLPVEPYTAGLPHLVTGWGRINTPDNPFAAHDPVLRKVFLRAIDKIDCNHPNMYDGRITPGMFCAGYAEGGRDACQGDSGGPLFRNQEIPGNPGIPGDPRNQRRWYLYGLVSWGFDCAKPNKPGVYTDVYYFTLWIKQQIFENS